MKIYILFFETTIKRTIKIPMPCKHRDFYFFFYFYFINAVALNMNILSILRPPMSEALNP